MRWQCIFLALPHHVFILAVLVGDDEPNPSPRPLDIAHAISLIQAAYAPTAASDLPALQSLQSALLAMQRTPAAWGLIVPLLAHEDTNVQFFGAHTAHAKISRGRWRRCPGKSRRRCGTRWWGWRGSCRLRAGTERMGGLGGWDGGEVVEAGAPSGHVHEFLAGAAEDVGRRICCRRPNASLRAAAPLVFQSIAAVLASLPPKSNPSQNLNEKHRRSRRAPLALACLVAWLPNCLLPDADVATLVPPLIALLLPLPLFFLRRVVTNLDATDDKASTAAASALTELLARPPPRGAPLSCSSRCCSGWAGVSRVYSHLHSSNSNYTQAQAQLKRHAKLLVALAEAGVEWVAEHVVDCSTISFPASGYAANAGYAGQMGGAGVQGGAYTGAQGAGTQGGVARSTLAQTLLRVVLALTAVDPGGARGRLSSPSFGRTGSQGSGFGSASQGHVGGDEDDGEDESGDEDDEDEDQPSGAPLYFWYLLQEALWEVPCSSSPTPHIPPSMFSNNAGFCFEGGTFYNVSGDVNLQNHEHLTSQHTLYSGDQWAHEGSIFVGEEKHGQGWGEGSGRELPGDVRTKRRTGRLPYDRAPRPRPLADKSSDIADPPRPFSFRQSVPRSPPQPSASLLSVSPTEPPVPELQPSFHDISDDGPDSSHLRRKSHPAPLHISHSDHLAVAPRPILGGTFITAESVNQNHTMANPASSFCIAQLL
ncbi:hypothetical protein B0H13DRAFT_2324470 [Mycena leptocephala]|nr:hypothetical protein B0H13DRAFT_2324470 [Mycena leptocephala]